MPRKIFTCKKIPRKIISTSALLLFEQKFRNRINTIFLTNNFSKKSHAEQFFKKGWRQTLPEGPATIFAATSFLKQDRVGILGTGILLQKPMGQN
jgi:hypothetical protein